MGRRVQGWWEGWGLREAKGGGGESGGNGVGRRTSYNPPGCLIWGAVETLGWAASAKSKQNG